MLNWQLLAEKRILAAMERGEFDDLPGQGEPLRWRENPLVPPEWRLAFGILDRAGLAPDWIMRDAEIRRDLAVVERKRQQEGAWMEERREAMAQMTPVERVAERTRLREVRSHTWEQLASFLQKLNRKINDFNLIVPLYWLQRPLLDLDEERAALQQAWGPLDTEEDR